MSNKSKKMTEKAKTWKRFEMEPLEPPFSPKKKREAHFAPFQTGEGENGDFIPLKESGEYQKRRKEAADILREAKEKAALLEQEAYEKGFAQGEKDGLELGEKKALKVIENIENFLIEVSHLKKEILKRDEKEILDIVFAIAKKVTHNQISLDEKAVKDTVLSAIHLATEKSHIILRINPEDLDYIEGLKPDLFAQYKELKSIDVTPDPTITRGGCFLETPYGDVDARVETQLERINQCLEEAFTEREND